MKTRTKTVGIKERDPGKFHHGHLREALLTRLLEVLDAEGVQGTGVRRLARDLRVDAASVYRHFRDLEALHQAAAEVCVASFVGVLERAAARSQSDADDAASPASFRRLGEAYVRHASAHPHRFRLIFGVPSAATSEVFLSVVRRAVGEADAHVAWSMVHGVAALTTEGPLGVAEQKRLLGRALDIVVHAVFKSQPRRR